MTIDNKPTQAPLYLTPEMLQQLQQPHPADDEIDLRELFAALWKGKWLIILCTIIFAAGSTLFAINQPNYYKAQVLLAPSSGDSGGNALGGLGGLAALAGVNIGGAKDDKTQLALAVLKSREFQTRFINKNELKVPLFAGQKWDPNNDELLLDADVYNTSSQQWTREVEPGKTPEPTDWEAYKEFSAIIATSQDKENGLVTVSAEFLSPTMAKQWIELLVQDLNKVMKERELVDTQRNIDYLEQQLQSTTIADMQSVFYQLIEEQLKNRMLAEVQDEYVFKIVDPPVVPEEKSKPKRALICVSATLLGGMLGCAIVLVRFAFRKERSRQE